MHKIEVPFKSDYAEGTASGVPQAIYVKIEGSFFLKNNPTYENQNLITFTPLLQEFLTVSAFDKKELRDFIKEIEIETGLTPNSTELKSLAWQELYARTDLSAAHRTELDTALLYVTDEAAKIMKI